MNVAQIPGLQALWAETLGDPRIRIAVLDGPVDQTHPCFEGARLSRLPGVVAESAGSGQMSAHGTHVTSMLFGRHVGEIKGIAPGCSGFIVPIFSDERQGPVSQQDLANAIHQAVDAGAHVINISGGELSQLKGVQTMLRDAVQHCADNGTLIVAAAGNNACECLHIPAALPTVLAVGATDDNGQPLPMSNWGPEYRVQGILAPGENMPGALPSGGVTTRSGTSFATPVVSGVAVLLLSRQLQQGLHPDPHQVREALLNSAIPCDARSQNDCRRFLAGTLNVSGARNLLSIGGFTMSDQELGTVTPLAEGYSEHVESQAAGVLASEFVEPQGESADAGQDAAVVAPSAAPPRGTITASRAPGTAPSHGRSAQMVPSACACQGQAGNTKVFAIGVLGYDFGTEARRDTFKQLMPQVTPQEKEGLIPVLLGMKPYPPPNEIFPANPYDFRQMVNYLRGYPGPEVPFPTEGGFPRLPFKHTEIVAEQKKDLSLPDPNQMHSFVDYPTSMHGDAFPPQIGTCPKNYPGFPGYISEASRLIWTLNIELTPVYAIRPSGSFTDLVYLRLVQALAGQVRSRDDDYYVSRVSIPGVLTGETVRLFSGQVVPVLEPQLQGMYSWNETKLICDAAEARGMDPHSKEPNVRRFRKFMDTYLNKLYYQLRNLGQTSAERALNFAATNAFQFATIAEDEATMEDEEGKPATRQLDTILVERSAFCRMDSDCWDVRIKFFDPNNHLKARSVYRYTVDVSDVHPVTIGEVRRWEEAFG